MGGGLAPYKMSKQPGLVKDTVDASGWVVACSTAACGSGTWGHEGCQGGQNESHAASVGEEARRPVAPGLLQGALPWNVEHFLSVLPNRHFPSPGASSAHL